MQRTTFGEIEPARTGSKLDEYRPTLVVWSDPALSSSTNTHHHPPERYPVQEGLSVITRQIGHATTVHYERTNDPEGVFKRGSPSKHTDFYPRDSERRFYPQGIDSLESHLITQSACIYTRGNRSYIGKPDGGVPASYPCHPRLSASPAWASRPTNYSQAPQMPMRQHASLRYPPFGGSVGDHSDIPRTVSLRDLILDPTKNNDSGYGGSVFGSSVNGQRVKVRSAYDPFSNSGPGEADPEWNFSEGVDGLSLGETGRQFPEIVIGDIEWAEDD